MGNKKGLIWYLTLFEDKEKTRPIKTIPCSTIKETIIMIEEIYNFRSKEKVRLY